MKGGGGACDGEGGELVLLLIIVFGEVGGEGRRLGGGAEGGEGE